MTEPKIIKATPEVLQELNLAPDGLREETIEARMALEKDYLERNPGIYHDEIWGDIQLSEVEQRIIQHPSFQRLLGVGQHQLRLTSYGSDLQISRFAHSIGAMHVAGRLADQLDFNPEETQRVRLAALLHDFAHLPYSHALDGFTDFDHDEHLGERLHETGVAGLIQQYGINPNQIIHELKEVKNPENPVGRVAKMLADRFDYMVRDFEFTTVSDTYKHEIRNIVEGLIENAELINRQEIPGPEGITILRGKVAFNEDAVDSLERFARLKLDFYINFAVHPKAGLATHDLRNRMQTAMDHLETGDQLSRNLLEMMDHELQTLLAEHDGRAVDAHVDQLFQPLVAFHLDDFTPVGRKMIEKGEFEQHARQLLTELGVKPADIIAGVTPVHESKKVWASVVTHHSDKPHPSVEDMAFGGSIEDHNAFAYVFVNNEVLSQSRHLAQKLRSELLHEHVLEPTAQLATRVAGIVLPDLYEKDDARRHLEHAHQNAFHQGVLAVFEQPDPDEFLRRILG